MTTVRQIDWSSLPYGQMSDAEIARRNGLCQTEVSRHRRMMGIPARDWTRGIDWDTQPLGQMPDPELARRLGVDHRLVWSARQSRGIPAFNRPRQAWTEAEMTTLAFHWGFKSPEELAKLLPGRSPLAIVEKGRLCGFGSTGRGFWTRQRLANHLGVSWVVVDRLAKQLRLRVARRPASEKSIGKKRQLAPLHFTDEQAAKIEAAYREEIA